MASIPHYPREISNILTSKTRSVANDTEHQPKFHTHRTSLPLMSTTGSSFLSTGNFNNASITDNNEKNLKIQKEAAPNLKISLFPSKSDIKRSLSQKNLHQVEPAQYQAQSQSPSKSPGKLHVNTNFNDNNSSKNEIEKMKNMVEQQNEQLEFFRQQEEARAQSAHSAQFRESLAQQNLEMNTYNDRLSRLEQRMSEAIVAITPKKPLIQECLACKSEKEHSEMLSLEVQKTFAKLQLQNKEIESVRALEKQIETLQTINKAQSESLKTLITSSSEMEIKLEDCTTKLDSTLRSNKKLSGDLEKCSKNEELNRKELVSLRRWKNNWEGVVEEWKA